MSSSNFASSFAPYTPPPDDPALHQGVSSSNSARISKAWFPNQATTDHSYQSGGVPTFGTSSAGGQGAAEEIESQTNQWETRFGLRVDALAAFAYILGPLSALALLILETHNDFVRFHAYQSGLLSGPLLLIRLFASLLHFPQWLKFLVDMFIMVTSLSMAIKTFIDADRHGLARFQLPYIGSVAARWLSEE